MKKFIIDEEEVSESDFWKEFEENIRLDVEENLDDLIDEENEEIFIGALCYSASQVLRNIDPVAYRCYADDVYEYNYRNMKDELNNGYEQEAYGCKFLIQD